MSRIKHYKNLSLKNIKGEKWFFVLDFEENYMISNFSRIKRINGIVGGSKIPRDFIVSQFKDKKGYVRASMRKKEKLLQIQVHRIVAIQFIENPKNKPQVNHKNGIKDDNRIKNLEWSTPLENLNHAFENGLRVLPKGEKHHNSKIPDHYVKVIRRLYNINPKFKKRKVANRFNCSISTISNIVLNKSKKHLL